MEFVETPTFTRSIVQLMRDDDYAQLQLVLAKRPEIGKIIAGSGGIRKARWAGSGRGKRGGLRVIYFWEARANRIWMLLAYPKSEKDDLSPAELKMLKKLVKESLR